MRLVPGAHYAPDGSPESEDAQDNEHYFGDAAGQSLGRDVDLTSADRSDSKAHVRGAVDIASPGTDEQERQKLRS